MIAVKNIPLPFIIKSCAFAITLYSAAGELALLFPPTALKGVTSDLLFFGGCCCFSSKLIIHPLSILQR